MEDEVPIQSAAPIDSKCKPDEAGVLPDCSVRILGRCNSKQLTQLLFNANHIARVMTSIQPYVGRNKLVISKVRSMQIVINLCRLMSHQTGTQRLAIAKETKNNRIVTVRHSPEITSQTYQHWELISCCFYAKIHII
jgi:hypothetical protein